MICNINKKYYMSPVACMHAVQWTYVRAEMSVKWTEEGCWRRLPLVVLCVIKHTVELRQNNWYLVPFVTDTSNIQSDKQIYI